MTHHPTHLKLLIGGVRAVAAAGALAALMSLPLMLLSRAWFDLQAQSMVSGLDPSLIGSDERTRWLTVLSCVPGAALWLLALLNLWRLFGRYAQGCYFDPQSLAFCRRFAGAIFAIGVFSPLQGALQSMALTSGRPPGQRMLTLGFGGNDLMGILLGAVFLVIAVVMARAAALEQENAEFV